jgi:hypothetical protein
MPRSGSLGTRTKQTAGRAGLHRWQPPGGRSMPAPVQATRRPTGVVAPGRIQVQRRRPRVEPSRGRLLAAQRVRPTGVEPGSHAGPTRRRPRVEPSTGRASRRASLRGDGRGYWRTADHAGRALATPRQEPDHKRCGVSSAKPRRAPSGCPLLGLGNERGEREGECGKEHGCRPAHAHTMSSTQGAPSSMMVARAPRRSAPPTDRHTLHAPARQRKLARTRTKGAN